MTDPGLNRRLRQRSRRAGLMIGVSMALTIAVCVGSFSVIYASLDTFIGDFISREAPTAVVATQPPAQVAAVDAPTQPPAPAQPTQPAAQPTAPAVVETPVATQPAFTPDYQTSSQYSLRLRSEPSTDGPDSTIILVLPPASPLQYMNQEQPTENPAEDGDRWLRFKTEDGQEGWLREIDVEIYQP